MKEGQTTIEGLIVVDKKTNEEITINAKSRMQLMYNDTGKRSQGEKHLEQKLGFLDFLIEYEYKLFGERREDITDAYCNVKDAYEVYLTPPPPPNTPPTAPPGVPCDLGDCEGYTVEMCINDIGLGPSWSFGSSCNLPPHLDHDHDCVPNSVDPEFQGSNMTQQEFEQWVRDYWDENYEDEYGDYDDFFSDYEGYFHDGYNGGANVSLDDLWENIEDIWSDITNIFDDIFGGDSQDDLYHWEDYYDDSCPWDGPLQGGGTGDRSIECSMLLLFDDNCVHDPWWEMPYGTDEARLLSARLSNYLEANNLGQFINSQSEIESQVIQEGISPFDFDFEYKILQLLLKLEFQELVDAQQTNLSEQDFFWNMQSLEFLFTSGGYERCFPDATLIKMAMFMAKHDASEDVLEYLQFAIELMASNSNYKWEKLEEFFGPAQNLDPTDAVILFEKILSFEETYELSNSNISMFQYLTETAINGNCLTSSNFDLCLADEIFAVEGVSSNDPSIIQDLPSLLNDCFNIGFNTGPAFTHKITLYTDQPWPDMDIIFSPQELVGHCFLGLTQTISNGTQNSQVFGFYPNGTAKPSIPTRPGAFKNDKLHDYDVSITWSVSASDFNNLVSHIATNINNWDTYNLDNANCTDFVMDACNSIGLNIYPPKGKWVTIVTGQNIPPLVIPHEGYCPSKLGQYMRSMQLGQQNAVRNSSGGTANDSFCN